MHSASVSPPLRPAQDVERLHKVSDSTLIGAGGEFSDFQKIQQILEELTGTDRVRCTRTHMPR